MPATAEKKRRAPSRRKKKKSPLLHWWPLLLGIVVTPIAVHAASIFALEGPYALELLYPWVRLAQASTLHLPIDFQNQLSQGILYLQFPVYGLIMVLLMRKGFLTALISIIVLHAAGIIAVSMGAGR